MFALKKGMASTAPAMASTAPAKPSEFLPYATCPEVDSDDPDALVKKLEASRIFLKTFSGKFGAKKTMLDARELGTGLFRFSCSENKTTVVVVDIRRSTAYGSVCDIELDAKDVADGTVKPPDLYVEVKGRGKRFTVRDKNRAWFVLNLTVI